MADFLKRLSAIVFMLFVTSSALRAQKIADFDEVVVSMNGKLTGSVDVTALIFEEKAYLPVHTLFQYLHIKNDFSANRDSLYGFILNQDDRYSIHPGRLSIRYKGQLQKITENDVIVFGDDFYLESSLWTKIFALDCEFNFRALHIQFTTKIDLPYAAELRREQLRKNLQKIRGQEQPDYTLAPSRPFFHLGAFDWDVNAARTTTGNIGSFKAGLGGNLLGGDFNALLFYNSNQVLQWKNQNYLWRFVDNDNKIWKQIFAGRVNTGQTYSLYNSINAVLINNISTKRKKSFGSYRVTNTTEPNWTVELYLNDVLVDYTKADASGFFSFEVPLLYGNNKINYKFYGPYGEEKIGEEIVNIPYNLVQPGQLEYTLMAGLVENGSSDIFSKGTANYGINKSITAGMGMEFNTGSAKQLIPYITASTRLARTMVLSAQYAPGIVMKSDLTYRLKSNIQLNVNYARYRKNQLVVRTNVLNETKAVATLPFQLKRAVLFGKLQYSDVQYLKSRIQTGELMWSFSKARFNINLSGFARFPGFREPGSRFSMSLPGPKGIRILPYAQFFYSEKNFGQLRLMLEKNLTKANMLSIGYEINRQMASKGFTVQFRKNLHFAQASTSINQDNDFVNFSQSFSGGISRVPDKKRFKARPLKSVGRTLVDVSAFLDYNNDGYKQGNEPVVKGLIVRVEGANVENDASKTSSHVTGLEPYTRYNIVLDENSFENPAWRLAHKVIGITPQPNFFENIEVPVTIMGEVNGYVRMQKDSSTEAVPRMRLYIFNDRGQQVGKTLSEEDGYFSYLGLHPGTYSITVDADQAAALGWYIKERKHFTIKADIDGDIAPNVDVLLIHE